MKCIKCSKETKNENELCEKCLAKENLKKSKAELKQAKKDLKKAKFETIDIDTEPAYGKTIIPTGLRSGIISLSSGVAALFFTLLILPGLIFGFLSLVEGVITIIDVIRNNKIGKRRLFPLAFAIVGICLSIIAIIISLIFLLSVVMYLLGSTTIFGLVAIVLAFFMAL